MTNYYKNGARNLRDRVIYGGTPGDDPGSFFCWIDNRHLAVKYCHPVPNPSRPGKNCLDFRLGSDEERRMFLLFICEAEGFPGSKVIDDFEANDFAPPCEY